MKARVRYALVFTGSTIARVYLHEIGHAVAWWMQGIPASAGGDLTLAQIFSGLRIPHSIGLDAALRI